MQNEESAQPDATANSALWASWLISNVRQNEEASASSFSHFAGARDRALRLHEHCRDLERFHSGWSISPRRNTKRSGCRPFLDVYWSVDRDGGCRIHRLRPVFFQEESSYIQRRKSLTNRQSQFGPALRAGPLGSSETLAGR